MDKLFDNLSQLGEMELRMLFNNLLQTVDRKYKSGSEEDKRVAEGLVDMIQEHMNIVSDHKLHTNERERFIHIVFSLSDAGSLKVTLSKIDKQDQCKVLAFNEWFSVGPISNIDTTAGQQDRLLWQMEFDEDFRSAQYVEPAHQLANMVKAVKDIPEHKTIVIWCADNAHDQTGLRFVLHLLRERKENVHVVNVTELYQATEFQSLKDVIAPYASGLIDRNYYQAIVRDYYEGIPLHSSQRKRYESEWEVLSSSNHVLRLWEEGTVTGKDENALDEIIIKSIIELEEEQDEDGYILAGSVVGRVLDASRQLISYSFISVRIWTLVNQGILLFRGLPGTLYTFSIKLKARLE